MLFLFNEWGWFAKSDHKVTYIWTEASEVLAKDIYLTANAGGEYGGQMVKISMYASMLDLLSILVLGKGTKSFFTVSWEQKLGTIFAYMASTFIRHYSIGELLLKRGKIHEDINCMYMYM